MVQGSQWENVYTRRGFFFFVCFFLCFVFLPFNPPVFPPFSLFPSLFFRLLLCISYARPFEPRLIGVDGAALRSYNVKPNIFGPNIFLYMLESWCSYYYYPAYYCIKWYWNWQLPELISPLESFKKCWIPIMHKYPTAVERIRKPTKMWQNKF